MSGRRKWINVATIVLFLVYTGWMVGPYLRSVIVRDASITTWSHAAVAPIAGRIITQSPEIGSRVGEDLHIATIRNDFLFSEKLSVEATRDRLILAESQLSEAKAQLTRLEDYQQLRKVTRDRSADIFHQQLESEIRNLEAEMKVNAERIDVLQRIAERKQSLVEGGSGSAASLDEELLRLAQSKLRQAELQGGLDFARLRDGASEDGVYIDQSGGTPDWFTFAELELWLEMNKARQAINLTEIRKKEAQRDLTINLETLKSLSEAKSTAPVGSTILSVLADEGETVVAGEPIVEWIDCSLLMVDVPVSDAVLPLIRRGAMANVVLEGRSQTRTGQVLLTRGSTATLGRTDLAAVAKGRVDGVAQVLLSIDLSDANFDECPVGQSAYVDFPGVGLVDVLRARLRL